MPLQELKKAKSINSGQMKWNTGSEKCHVFWRNWNIVRLIKIKERRPPERVNSLLHMCLTKHQNNLLVHGLVVTANTSYLLHLRVDHQYENPILPRVKNQLYFPLPFSHSIAFPTLVPSLLRTKSISDLAHRQKVDIPLIESSLSPIYKFSN